MARFTPLTDEELQIAALVPEGTYSYKVIKSEEKISQAGNDYIAINLKIWDDEGKEHLIFGNLSFVKIFKHFADVNDMLDFYNAGEIPAHTCLNKSGGKVVIGIEGEKPDGKGGVYKAKNNIKDFVNPAGSLLNPIKPVYQSNVPDFVDDTLPF